MVTVAPVRVSVPVEVRIPAELSYSNLLALIQSLAGVDSFTTAEQTKILAMCNRRLYQAYNASPMWPRYLKASQARPAPNGIIPFEYDNSAGIRTSTGTETRTGATVMICMDKRKRPPLAEWPNSIMRFRLHPEGSNLAPSQYP